MKKKQGKKKDADHLEWLVRCRSQNQHTSLVLYKLMIANAEHLKKETHLANTGISLVAILFNLWRAVFLADIEDIDIRQSIPDRMNHAISFLRTLISDNAIAYVQDKNARAWSCVSYLNNARYRLKDLSEKQLDILPNFSIPDDKITVRIYWETLQENTDLAVRNYANALKKRQKPE